MKTDKEYSHIKVCPVTNEQLFYNDIHRTEGVCPKCGDDGNVLTHHTKIVGRWVKPSLLEKLMLKKATFLRKDEEDTIMNALKGKI